MKGIPMKKEKWLGQRKMGSQIPDYRSSGSLVKNRNTSATNRKRVLTGRREFKRKSGSCCGCGVKTEKELVDYETRRCKDDSWTLDDVETAENYGPLLKRTPSKGSHIHSEVVKTELENKHVSELQQKTRKLFPRSASAFSLSLSLSLSLSHALSLLTTFYFSWSSQRGRLG